MSGRPGTRVTDPFNPMARARRVYVVAAFLYLVLLLEKKTIRPRFITYFHQLLCDHYQYDLQHHFENLFILFVAAILSVSIRPPCRAYGVAYRLSGGRFSTTL